jgi:glycosyltransferase involved in cell wall biosynthesis
LAAISVLHVSPSFARKDGGPSEVLRGLIPAISATGVRVTVATTDKGADALDYDFVDRNSVEVFASTKPLTLNRSRQLEDALPTLVSNSDIVHIHSIHTLTSSVAMRVARELGVPYLLQPHGALDSYHLAQGRLKKTVFTQLVDRRNLDQLSGAIFSSSREMRDGRKFLPRTPSFQVTLGVDQSLVSDSPRKSSEAAPVVLFLGRVTAKKRLDLLLQAFSTPEVRKTGATLVVAGPIDPRLRYDPEKLVRELSLTSAVRFVGKVDSRARADLLAEASVFVLASEDESFGVAAAEAVAAGCPTVITANVGISDELAKVGGVRIVELNHHSIASEIASLIADPAEAHKMAKRGALYAREYYTWENAAAEALRVYEDVLSQAR